MTMTRSALFGRARRSTALRPPWAIAATHFHSACNGCGDCVKACPEGIVTIDDDALAQVDFRRGECTFCAECLRACTRGALARMPEGRPWRQLARISARCLAYARVTCRSCAENCESAALRFLPGAQGCFFPIIDDSLCSGCGACVAVCPVGAVNIEKPKEAIS